MTIPNRMKMNTHTARENRQRDSTKPFIAPRNDETSAAGMASMKVRPMAGESASHAIAQLSKPVGPPGATDSHGQRTGSPHELAGLTSCGGLRLVTMSTYTGINTTTRNSTRSTYFAVLLRRMRAPRPEAVGAFFSIPVVMVIGGPSLREPCR